MADRHKNRTHESEALRKRQAREKATDLAGVLEEAFDGINWSRRTRAERDFLFFLRTYCTSEDPAEGTFLEIPPASADMIGIVRDMEQAIGDASIPYHIRVARGHGKTAYSKGAALWTAATGRRRYIVVVGANEDNAGNIIEDVFACMTQSSAFVQDFPEIAVPFLKLSGAYQRAKTQRYNGVPTKLSKSAGKIVFPTIKNPKTGENFASSGVVLEAVGFNAGARGKSKGILRPDFIIFDDLQNDEKAQNEGQVGKMAAKIKKTFMGLAGHRKKIAAIMTSTPIEVDDLSELFAADPGWKTKTYPMLISWPKCHNLDADPAERKGVRDLWDEYWDIYNTEKAADRVPHIAANRFYRKNRKAMDDGARVLNPKNYDPTTEVSAIQHALNILYRDGYDTFMSEYQMRPPRNAFAFALTPKLILQRIRHGVPANTIPAGTVLTVAATDINPGYGLTTAVLTFDISLTAFVTAYHVFPVKIPEKLNDVEFNRRLHAALLAHGKEIARLGIRLDRWCIDGGGRQFKAVTTFAASAEAEVGLSAVAMLGRAGQNWNPNVRSRIRNEKNSTVLCRDPDRRRWIAWNADEYKERAHRAWNTDTGAAGGLSIFDGNANHYKFAVQVSNERLVSKTKTKDRNGKECYSYKWKTKNPHDFGDCVAMCYAYAGSEGITGEEETVAKKKRHLAIGGRIVGGKPQENETPPAEAPAATEPASETPPPAARPAKRRRVAIGGRLY